MVLRSALPPKLCGPQVTPLTPWPLQGFRQRGLVDAQTYLVPKFTWGGRPALPSRHGSSHSFLTGTQVICRCGLPLDDASASVLRPTVNSVPPFCTNSEPPESKDTPHPSILPLLPAFLSLGVVLVTSSCSMSWTFLTHALSLNLKLCLTDLLVNTYMFLYLFGVSLAVASIKLYFNCMYTCLSSLFFSH